MRLGLLGGTFDPPHIGHLLVAVDAFDILELDRIVVMPAAGQPLKTAIPALATAGQRLEMCRLTFAGDPRFEVSTMEIERGGLSYTVDTLEELAATNREAELFLLVGNDTLATLHRWKWAERIAELARLAVLERDVPAAPEVPPGLAKGAVRVNARRVDVSSTEIRQRIRDGKSIRGFVTEPVEGYISAAQLYAEGRAGGAGREARKTGDRGDA